MYFYNIIEYSIFIANDEMPKLLLSDEKKNAKEKNIHWRRAHSCFWWFIFPMIPFWGIYFLQFPSICLLFMHPPNWISSHFSWTAAAAAAGCSSTFFNEINIFLRREDSSVYMELCRSIWIKFRRRQRLVDVFPRTTNLSMKNIGIHVILTFSMYIEFLPLFIPDK